MTGTCIAVQCHQALLNFWWLQKLVPSLMIYLSVRLWIVDEKYWLEQETVVESKLLKSFKVFAILRWRCWMPSRFGAFKEVNYLKWKIDLLKNYMLCLSLNLIYIVTFVDRFLSSRWLCFLWDVSLWQHFYEIYTVWAYEDWLSSIL